MAAGTIEAEYMALSEVDDRGGVHGFVGGRTGGHISRQAQEFTILELKVHQELVMKDV